MERLRRNGTNDIVDLCPHFLAGLRRCRRNCDDDAGRLQLSQGLDGGMHGGAGCQTVIHQNHGATANVGGRSAAAIETLAPRQLLVLSFGNRLDQIVRDPEAPHELVIEHTHAAARDRAHRQLLVARDAQLAHDKDVERRAERTGDFVCDGHATARERQHEHVRAIGVSGELGRQAAGPPRGDRERDLAQRHPTLRPCLISSCSEVDLR